MFCRENVQLFTGDMEKYNIFQWKFGERRRLCTPMNVHVAAGHFYAGAAVPVARLSECAPSDYYAAAAAVHDVTRARLSRRARR